MAPAVWLIVGILLTTAAVLLWVARLRWAGGSIGALGLACVVYGIQQNEVYGP